MWDLEERMPFEELLEWGAYFELEAEDTKKRQQESRTRPPATRARKKRSKRT